MQQYSISPSAFQKGLGKAPSKMAVSGPPQAFAAQQFKGMQSPSFAGQGKGTGATPLQGKGGFAKGGFAKGGCGGVVRPAGKGAMGQVIVPSMKGKGKTGKGKLPASSPVAVKGKGKVATKIAAGEPAFVGRVRTYNPEKSHGLISCPECWAMCKQEVYVFKKVLESCGATVGDTVAFMVHWNAKGQPQASQYPEILRLCNAQGDMALKGTFKWGPQQQFGFIRNAEVEAFFGRDTYVKKELADNLDPAQPVAFNIKLNKDYQPCASEAVICDVDWEPFPGDLSTLMEDTTCPPAWEAFGMKKDNNLVCTPTGEQFTATLKSFKLENGWGFLTSEELQERFNSDVFVHQKEMLNCPVKEVGMLVNFELGVTEEGKPQALQVYPAGDDLLEPPSKKIKLEDFQETGQDESLE